MVAEYQRHMLGIAYRDKMRETQLERMARNVKAGKKLARSLGIAGFFASNPLLAIVAIILVAVVLFFSLGFFIGNIFNIYIIAISFVAVLLARLSLPLTHRARIKVPVLKYGVVLGFLAWAYQLYLSSQQNFWNGIASVANLPLLVAYIALFSIWVFIAKAIIKRL